MKKPREILTIYLISAVLVTAPVFADDTISPIPFGGYIQDGKCGCYGAKVSVKTVNEARIIIEKFIEGHDLHIGAMDERPRYFRAELLDNNGTIRDVVIVHKANGRIRSTY